MDDIKRAAAERAKKLGVPYAGALLPAEAHKLMQAGAKLVDVRTKPELLYVGSIPGSLAIEWQTYPGSRPNPEFVGELAALTKKDEPVMFICRSGARSHGAAEAALRAGPVRIPLTTGSVWHRNCSSAGSTPLHQLSTHSARRCRNGNDDAR